MKKTFGNLKMFISYSHKDKFFLNELTKHLKTLEQRGIIEKWHDGELVAGDHINSEIEEHLLDADLVVFLVSADFISSYYCFEVELKKTFDRLYDGAVRIIPIIVRPCKWKDTVLSRYLAATKDGKPISKYDNADDAWVEVVGSIERAVNKYLESKEGKENNNPSSIEKKLILNSNFVEKLKDTEIVFQHKNKEKILLDDIFIYPDLKNIKQEYDGIEKNINSCDLSIFNDLPEKLLIFGSEQSGKTSLSKMLLQCYCNQGSLPLLCNGREIKSTDIDEKLSKLTSEQYNDLTYDDYIVQQRKKLLIIDDFDECKLNIRYQNKFLDNALKSIDKLILISDSSIRYDKAKYIELSDYSQYEILPFGNLRRNELIEKWIGIGRIETIAIGELYNENDRVTRHVNSIIRKNILPSKPIYVLTIIQLLDTTTTDYSLTSYGHCYQSLIQTALEKLRIKATDFDLYINYLSEIAFFIFNTGNEIIDDTQLVVFKTKYSKEYLVQSHDKIIKILLTSGILREYDGKINFGYRYIFYFYVAKYLADHIGIENCKKEIKRLCENIHTEKNANILIFLVHHSKDQKIIDEILNHASAVFDKTKKASLNVEDTKYLLDYIVSIPKLVIEQRNIDDERKKRLKAKDQLDDIVEKSDDLNSDPEDKSDHGISAEINRSVRFVEIIGQILRNRQSSLKKEQLTDLCLSAYSSGLKFLNYFLIGTRENQEYILKFIRDIFYKNTSFSDDNISKEARKIFLTLCYGTSYLVIQKIANSLGSEELMPIFEEISSKHPESPVIQLIHITIQLEFTKKIPKKEIYDMYLKLKNNPIAQRLLQELVIQHLYLNCVDYRDKQWISDTLKLPIKSQQILQNKTGCKI